jgi:hypothetical protein
MRCLAGCFIRLDRNADPPGSRQSRESVSASTPFIGAGGNNFSHFFKGAHLGVCRAAAQFVAEYDNTVPIRCIPCMLLRQKVSAYDAAVCTVSSRGAGVRDRWVGVEVSHPSRTKRGEGGAPGLSSIQDIPQASPQKNRRQEDRPLPPPVLRSTVFALCL